MKKVSKKILISSSLVLLTLVGVTLCIDYALFKPTKINSFIASKIYKTPANKAFTDENFYKCVVDAYNNKNNTSVAYTDNLTDEQLSTITSLYCSNKEIKEINGILKLSNVEYIDFGNNLITEANISSLNKLESFNFGGNDLLDGPKINNKVYLEVDKKYKLKLNLSLPQQFEIEYSDVMNRTLFEKISDNEFNITLSVTYGTEMGIKIKNINTNNYSNVYYWLVGYKINAIDDIILFNDENYIVNPFISPIEYDELNNFTIKHSCEDISINQNIITSTKSTDCKLTIVGPNNIYSFDVNVHSINFDVTQYKIEGLNIFTGYDNTEDKIRPNLILDGAEMIFKAQRDGVNRVIISYNGKEIQEYNIFYLVAENINKFDVQNLYDEKPYVFLINDSINKLLTEKKNYVSGWYKQGSSTYGGPFYFDYDEENQLLKSIPYTIIVFNLNTMYNVNVEEGYIYTGLDNDSETILSNINLNYGEASIEDNKLLIKYDGELIKSFDIVNVSSSKYDISKSYIYTGTNDLSLEDINVTKGKKIVEDSKLKIKYNDNILKEYDLVKISSEKYDLTKEYIFDNEFNVNNITLTNGTKTLKDNKLLIKYSDEVLESYDIVTLSSKTYDLTKDYIFTEEELNLDLINTTNLTKEVINNKLVIKYNNEIFKSIDIVNISSSKYDLSKKYIYTLTEELDLNNINVINGQKSIEDNKLLIKYDGELIKSFDIVKISNEKYDLTKGYIFDNEFNIDNITLTNGTKEVKDNQLLIKYDEDLLQSYDLISISSDKYDLTKDYIYIGTSPFTFDDFKVTKIKWALKDSKLEFKSHNGDLIKEYQVISINFGEYKTYDGLLILPEDITYEELTNNITTNGVTYKIFNGESEVTEGNLSEGMIVKIYYGDEVIDKYEVTNEYLELDESLNIDNEVNIIEKLPRNLKLKDFISLINTSGSIEVRNNNNELLSDDSIIGTGSKVKITLSKRTVEYTLSVKGDVTGNGQAKMADVMKIATHIIEGNIISGDAFERAADITGDGKIKMNDVMKLATFIIDGGEL